MAHNLTREMWNSLSLSDKMVQGRRLAGNLPSGFTYDSVRHFQYCNRNNDVATYRFESKLFALVPGGSFAVGRAADTPWQPTTEEIEEWDDTAESYDLDGSLPAYIASVTLRPRIVEFPTMLVETEVEEYGWDPIMFPTMNGDVKRVVQDHFESPAGERQVDSYSSGAWLRVNRDRAGKLTAKRDAGLTQAEISARLKSSGFRFPTSDEWEYLCGESAQTLFRWGDHAPLDRDPSEFLTDSNSKADDGRSSAFPPGWREHIYPNALGMTIARNSYYYELVAEPNTTRGGDGGSVICGGGGRILSWLTLATSYFEESVCTHDPLEPIAAGYTIGRRVFQLS